MGDAFLNLQSLCKRVLSLLRYGHQTTSQCCWCYWSWRSNFTRVEGCSAPCHILIVARTRGAIEMFDVSATIVWRSGLAGQAEESKPECAHLTSFWCWLRQEGCEIASHAFFVTSLDRFAMLLFDRILIMLCDCAPDEPQSFHTDVSLSAGEPEVQEAVCERRWMASTGCRQRGGRQLARSIADMCRINVSWKFPPVEIWERTKRGFSRFKCLSLNGVASSQVIGTGPTSIKWYRGIVRRKLKNFKKGIRFGEQRNGENAVQSDC